MSSLADNDDEHNASDGSATAAREVSRNRKLRIRHRLRQLILAVSAAGLLGCVGMAAGAGINDFRIAQDPGRALATVTETGLLRTTVEFRDGHGLYQAPSTGVLYPTGLGEGQQVWINYARSQPEVVKVEGRQWTLAIIPALSIAAVVIAVAVAAWHLTARLGREPRRPRGPRQG